MNCSWKPPNRSQRVAPQLGHFALPPGRAVPQFAANFLIAGATTVGCAPIDWDPVEDDPLLYCPDFSSCQSAPSTAPLTLVAYSPMTAIKMIREHPRTDAERHPVL